MHYPWAGGSGMKVSDLGTFQEGIAFICGEEATFTGSWRPSPGHPLRKSGPRQENDSSAGCTETRPG